MARLLKKKKESVKKETTTTQKRKCVLVVDDSEMIRNFHCYILKNAGFDVLSAIDGADGMEKLLRNHVDAVITDINMPNMDGLTFVQRLRENLLYEEIPVIIVSTEDEAEDKQQGFDAGANIYIVKPTEPAKLIENIKMLL